MSDDLIRQDAVTIVARLKSGEVTPHDLLDALEKRIAAVDRPGERAADALLRPGAAARGPADEEAGRRSAASSPACRSRSRIWSMSRACAARRARRSTPTHSREIRRLVEHLEAEGGIVYAMSNTPEFGAGANTFNEVFGATRNPWNTSRSAAGSSGGAAVALATGMAWLAHGSDMGGSLRNPASFNGIVGFRPSIGRVAHTPSGAIEMNLGQQGPMARNVEDCALLLDAMCGEDPRDPFSLPRTGESYLAAARSGWRPKRVA